MSLEEQHQLLHLLARLRVERAEGLVHEQHLRPVRQRARDGRALLHAAAQLARVGAAKISQAHDLEESVRALRVLAVGPGAPRVRGQPEGEAGVLLDGEPGEERVALEDHAPLRSRPVHANVVEEDLTGGRNIEPGDDAEGGRLAAARRAEQAHELAAAHREGGRRQRDDLTLPPRVGLGETAHVELHRAVSAQWKRRRFRARNAASRASPMRPSRMT